MAEGFTVEGFRMKLIDHPVEDAYKIIGDISAVADGVTRDPSLYLPNRETYFGKLKFILNHRLNYPRPSPARIAADIFVESFCDILREYNEDNRDEKAVRKAFEESNKGIGRWNYNNIPSPDYVMNDFAGCVAAGTSRNEEVISFGYLTDCGVAIFDAEGNLKFRTENQGPDKYNKYIWQDKRLKTKDWHNPEARRIVRRDYRNNPSEEHSFGVLTGENSAMYYVRTGTQELKDGESLIVYSDGLESIIFSGKFADLLRKGDLKSIKTICKKEVRTEGTLVYDYRKDYSVEDLRKYQSTSDKDWKREQVERDSGFR